MIILDEIQFPTFEEVLGILDMAIKEENLLKILARINIIIIMAQ